MSGVQKLTEAGFLHGLRAVLMRVFLFAVISIVAMSLKIYFLSFLISLVIGGMILKWCVSYCWGQFLKARNK